MPVPPLENCPDVEDCLADPSEIGRICTFAPLCGTCAVYRVIEGRRGLLLGTCRIRTERGEFACTAPICDAYVPRAGARPSPVVQIAKAYQGQPKQIAAALWGNSAAQYRYKHVTVVEDDRGFWSAAAAFPLRPRQA